MPLVNPFLEISQSTHSWHISQSTHSSRFDKSRMIWLTDVSWMSWLTDFKTSHEWFDWLMCHEWVDWLISWLVTNDLIDWCVTNELIDSWPFAAHYSKILWCWAVEFMIYSRNAWFIRVTTTHSYARHCVSTAHYSKILRKYWCHW